MAQGDPIDVDELAARVRYGIDASRKASSKWRPLNEWVVTHFEVPPDQVRASLLAEPANITNRVFKDTAWENPCILSLICVERVTPEKAERFLDELVRTFQSRIGAPPRLRVALIFDHDKLVKVKTLATTAGGPA